MGKTWREIQNLYRNYQLKIGHLVFLFKEPITSDI